MVLAVISKKLQDRYIDIIDSSLRLWSIESRTLDFKGGRRNDKSNELYDVVYAMDNPLGSNIVLTFLLIIEKRGYHRRLDFR